ncbi:MAG: hypothetical protein IJY11_03305 [Clostridia bacterium]|nr:hypothetical protein [Clostridia bacterium]
MSKLDLLKFLQTYGEEVSLADFTPEQLQEYIDELAQKEDLPMTPEAFKEAYFAYYDDVKDKTLKKQDW